MANRLEAAADNVFITSGNILDTITYRFSNTAIDISIPNNNDSLIAPLIVQLAEDLNVFNQVLDDYQVDIDMCRHILSSLQIKASKEKVIAEKREIEKVKQAESLRIQKEKDESNKLSMTGLQNQNSSRNDNNNTNASSNGFNNNQKDNPNIDNEIMLGLDLENFDFDEANDDINMNMNMNMNFNFEDSNAPPNIPNQQTASSSSTAIPNTTSASSQQISSNLSTNLNNTVSTNNGNEYLGFDQDADFDDLDFDFLQDEEMNALNNNNNINSNVSNPNSLNNAGNNGDQTGELFSQFDEMVGNNNI